MSESKDATDKKREILDIGDYISIALSSVSLLIAILGTIWTYQKAEDANKIAGESNRIATQANEIARDANSIAVEGSRSDIKIETTKYGWPIVSLAPCIHNFEDHPLYVIYFLAKTEVFITNEGGIPTSLNDFEISDISGSDLYWSYEAFENGISLTLPIDIGAGVTKRLTFAAWNSTPAPGAPDSEAELETLCKNFYNKPQATTWTLKFGSDQEISLPSEIWSLWRRLDTCPDVAPSCDDVLSDWQSILTR